MDLISKIVDVAKLPAKFVAGIFIASGFVVLSPELWLEKVGMTQLQAGYRTYFGLAFILSAAYLMAMLLAWVGCKFQGWNLRRRWKRIVRDEMQSCDRNEKAVLREFLLQKRNTLRMPVDDPVVAGLLSRGVLEEVDHLGHVRISPACACILTPQLVGLSGGLPTREQLPENLVSRPHFFRTH